MEYRTAPEVAKIVEDLVFDYHEDLSDRGPEIECVFLSQTPRSRGRDLLGKVRKVSGIHAYLAAQPRPENFDDSALSFFLLEIAQPAWVSLQDYQRKALVDHLLCHLAYDEENDAWRMRPPEYGEFPEIIERWGFWRPDDTFKELAVKVSEQLSLLPEEEQLALTENGQGEREPVGAASE